MKSCVAVRLEILARCRNLLRVWESSVLGVIMHGLEERRWILFSMPKGESPPCIMNRHWNVELEALYSQPKHAGRKYCGDSGVRWLEKY